VTLRLRALAVLAATTAVAGACTGAGGADPSASPSVDLPTVKVAYFQDGSIESPNTHGQPAFLGLKLALSQAIQAGGLPVVPELVGFDTKGDPEVASELAHEVADDPTYVAAVAGPYWLGTNEVAAALRAAGVPVLSLTGTAMPDDPGWLPIVAARRRQTAALAGYVRGRRGAGVCLAGDGTQYARTMGDEMERELRGGVYATVTTTPGSGDAPVAAATIRESGCATVVWTGFGTGAAELRDALTAVGSGSTPLVGVDAMKDPAFLDLAGSSADGTVVVCACLDLTASIDAAAQRFVHDYQADYAIPPGVYAAEGWDAGGLLIGAFTRGARTRATTTAELAGAAGGSSLASVSGHGAPAVHLSRAEGGRWVPLTNGHDPPPLRTDGVLSVGSCRTGEPFAYRDRRGGLVGFDVEFARAVAHHLDLALSWTRTACRAGTRPVDEGRVDVLMTASATLVPGTPSSGVFFSIRAALVMPAAEVSAGGHAPPLRSGDLVGVVAGTPITEWARRTLPDTGASLRVVRGPRSEVYDRLERGRLAAVADTEAAAWAAIEHRPTLLVGATDDTGVDDVMVVAAPATDLLTSVDDALARMLEDGDYALLFAKYFPGATLPETVGT
jgi:ABC-type amino acid transport substrate-binding protein/ABC-type branched-subunit amino acid transport system substrate-binding protein